MPTSTRADIHSVRVRGERMRLPEWDDLGDAAVALGSALDELRHGEDALMKHLATVPDAII